MTQSKEKRMYQEPIVRAMGAVASKTEGQGTKLPIEPNGSYVRF